MSPRWSRFGFVLAVLMCTAAFVPACATEAPVGPGEVQADASVDTSSSDGGTDAVVEPDVATDVPVEACPGGPGCACVEDGDCDDGDACTVDQLCVDGTCSTGFPLCNDGNACTDDSCGKDATCSHTALTGFCEDGTPCTVADTCQSGMCVPGKAKDCDDGEVCTSDPCDTAVGCLHIATDVTCVDESVCTTAGLCTLGHCQDGKAKACSDGQACTWDTCMPETGCTAFAVDVTATCVDSVHQGRCWKAVAATGTWTEARAACQAWGGDLAGVHSLPDNVFVRGVVDSTCGNGSAWLGYTDHMQESWWRWTDTEPRGFSHWADGEPNDSGGVEDFAVIGADGRWNDLDGSVTAPCFVCARPLALTCSPGSACVVAGCSAGACLPTGATEDCDDGNACTADACDPAKGCSHVSVASAIPCGIGTCDGDGACWGPTATESAPVDCAALLASAPTASDGVYWVDTDGGGAGVPYPVWCDMHTAGGGWTLAMKLDGNDPKFGWSGSAWVAPVSLGTSPSLDQTAAVFPAAWQVPVSEVRVGLFDGSWRWLQLPVKAASLQAIFVGGKHISTDAGMPGWLGLLGDGSLQNHCQTEGFNAASATTSIRVGILGNNENDCGTVDSWLGLGGTPSVCGIQGKPSVGNVACYGANNGGRKTATWGAILVR